MTKYFVRHEPNTDAWEWKVYVSKRGDFKLEKIYGKRFPIAGYKTAMEANMAVEDLKKKDKEENV